jgi:alpha-galactosidase
MLEVGNYNMQNLGVPPLSFTETRAHFGAWAIVSAPLVLGFDVTNTTTLDAVWPIISNTEVLAINADYAGFSGSRFFASDDVTTFTPCGWWAKNCSFPSVQFWYKPLSNGDVAILLMNNADSAAPLTLEFHDIPGFVMRQGSLAKVRDVWAHADLGEMDGAFSATVGSRDSVFLRITPVTSAAGTE